MDTGLVFGLLLVALFAVKLAETLMVRKEQKRHDFIVKRLSDGGFIDPGSALLIFVLLAFVWALAKFAGLI